MMGRKKNTDGPVVAGMRAWLTEVGLAESRDPNVAIMLRGGETLDRLDAGEYDLSDAKHLVVQRNAETSIANARKALQAEIDRADSAAARKRHQLIYAVMAGDSLGFVDPALLSDTLRAKISQELQEKHNIDLTHYEPIRKEG